MYPGVKQRAQLISPSRSAWLIMSWSSCLSVSSPSSSSRKDFLAHLAGHRREEPIELSGAVAVIVNNERPLRWEFLCSATQHIQSVGQSGRRMREAGAAPGRDGLLTWLLRQNERDGRLAGWQHACIDGWVDGLTHLSAAAHNHRAQPAHRRGVEPAIHSPINSLWLH